VTSYSTNQPPENTWILVFFEGYILGPKLVGALPSSNPAKDTLKKNTMGNEIGKC